ncbi:hypothetical protein J3A83DRAFT_4371001 [Scleroderma citrinum]
MLELDGSEDELFTDTVHSSTASGSLQPHFDSTDAAVDSDDSNYQHLHPLHPSNESSTGLRADRLSRPASRAEGGTRPRSAHLSPSEDETNDVIDNRGASDDDTTTIIHKANSLPGVALRYGVSIAALRRANQLWPSDPVHLRTELNIPRGDTPPIRRKLADPSQAHIDHTPEFPSRLSTDTTISALVAGRDTILSAFSARVSLESLSSRTSSSVSEVHELDDLAALRVSRRRLNARHTPVTCDGYELAVLRNSSIPDNVPAVASLPPLSCVGASNSNSGLENPPLLRDRPHRVNPSVFIPIRTSQLEPEPEMELPTRHHV